LELHPPPGYPGAADCKYLLAEAVPLREDPGVFQGNLRRVQRRAGIKRVIASHIGYKPLFE